MPMCFRYPNGIIDNKKIGIAQFGIEYPYNNEWYALLRQTKPKKAERTRNALEATDALKPNISLSLIFV